MRSTLHRIALAIAVVAIAAIVAVPALARQHRQSAVNIKVKAVDLKFIVPLKSAPHGRIQFSVVNKGALKHDFKIAGKKTPLIAPGQTKVLKLTLKKGKYTYLCTVPGHAAAGMKGTFTVK
jgi:plastocyanin